LGETPEAFGQNTRSVWAKHRTAKFDITNLLMIFFAESLQISTYCITFATIINNKMLKEVKNNTYFYSRREFTLNN